MQTEPHLNGEQLPESISATTGGNSTASLDATNAILGGGKLILSLMTWKAVTEHETAVQNEALKNLMMSWYYAGYYTGLYEGQRQGLAAREPNQQAT